MGLWILRGVFLLVAGGVGASIVSMNKPGTELPIGFGWWFFLSVIAGAVTIVIVDIVVPRKRLDLITSVYFGILVGLFLTYALGAALEPMMMRGLEPSPLKPIVQ